MEYKAFIERYRFTDSPPWKILNRGMLRGEYEDLLSDIPPSFKSLRKNKVESDVFISSHLMKIMFTKYSNHKNYCMISLRGISSVYSYMNHIRIFCGPVDENYDHCYNDFVYLKDILHPDRWKDVGMGRLTMREFCGPSEDHWLYPFLEPFMDVTFEEIRTEDDMKKLVMGGDER